MAETRAALGAPRPGRRPPSARRAVGLASALWASAPHAPLVGSCPAGVRLPGCPLAPGTPPFCGSAGEATITALSRRTRPCAVRPARAALGTLSTPWVGKPRPGVKSVAQGHTRRALEFEPDLPNLRVSCRDPWAWPALHLTLPLPVATSRSCHLGLGSDFAAGDCWDPGLASGMGECVCVGGVDGEECGHVDAEPWHPL